MFPITFNLKLTKLNVMFGLFMIFNFVFLNLNPFIIVIIKSFSILYAAYME